jgi:osmotically-inducible protein OsmY
MNKPIYNLQQQIHEALIEDLEMSRYDIEVLDNNGVITLRGTVPTVEAREKAEAVARSMERVISVINELDVV